MKTKLKYFSLAIAALLMVGFASCSSDDEPIKGVDEIETGGTKMQLVVNMPTGASTRSTTGTGDVSSEVGTDSENAANSVLVAIFDNANGSWVANYSQPLVLTSAGANKVNYQTQVFQADQLVVGKSYKVYVFVNPYPTMESKVNDLNAKFTPFDTHENAMIAIASAGKFLMSTSEPVIAGEVLQTADNKSTPFKVVANVERAVARFDYTAMNATNEYEVSGNSAIKVQFTDFKVLNKSKSFYHLKRVSTLGTVLAGDLGGAETVDNYVVDTDWAEKSGVATAWPANYFSYLEKNAEPCPFYALHKNSASEKLTYVTENTLPEVNASKKGLATAIVFKGKLVFDFDVYGGGAGVKVYVWNNKFYGSYSRLPVGVRNQVGADISKVALEAAGVTEYSYVDGGYPVYYVYYNRHNDNNNPALTGPMEFAVVRNNVYKLSINAVKLFGHPNDPQVISPVNADPTPEKPGDDIETGHIYMEVTTNVLPWVVRTNVIEF